MAKAKNTTTTADTKKSTVVEEEKKTEKPAKTETKETAKKPEKIEYKEGVLYDIHMNRYKNRKMNSCTPTIIEFNDKGIATAGPIEAENFSHFPDCTITYHKE